MTSTTDMTLPNEASDSAPYAARQRWLAVLAKASLDELEGAWTRLADKPAFRTLRASETGLVMVRGRIGGNGRPFNLGEMTATRAAVQLLDRAGAVAFVGFGHVGGRSARRAELVAIFDALLQDPSRRQRIEASVIAPLGECQRIARTERAAGVMGSKVDFFTMVRGE